MTKGWGNIDIGGDGTLDGRTWEDAIPKEERTGGPSEWGNSRWKNFLQCPWKYWVKHVRGLQVAPSHPRYETLQRNLWVGGLYHEARARYYLRHLDFVNQRGEVISNEPQSLVDEECTKAMFNIVDLAAEVQAGVAAEVRRLLMGWITLHGPGTTNDDRATTMYIENLLSTQKAGFQYSTRLDRVRWDEAVDGPLIQEHKTAGFYSESLLASYRMDPQILGQIYCWEHSPLRKKHGPLKAFEVDIAVKGAKREYYRHRVPIVLEAVEDWARCMKFEWASLLNCLATDVWPRRRANCFLWARACELHEVCADCPNTTNSKRASFAGFEKPKK